jgi:hypothetical protein
MNLITNFDSIVPYTEKLLYHCIWIGKPLNQHILCIASLFKTQINPSVVLWTDKESYPELARLAKTFIHRDFKIVIGEFEECESYGSTMFRADKWRLQILNKYGGIYFDLDIVFFKDISWFANYGKPIVHEGYTSEKAFNNAIMYFPKGHPGLKHWIDLIGTSRLGWDRIFNIQKVSDERFGADMIPNEVTDRGWTELGPACDDFFEKHGLLPEIMANSFLYHWHNRWTKSVLNKDTLANYYWNLYVVDNPSLEL